MTKPLTTQAYYSSSLYCRSVRANIDHSAPTWQGTVECVEHRENGRHKSLWKKRTGQRMARLTQQDALKDAINLAQGIIDQTHGVDCEIRIMGTIHPPIGHVMDDAIEYHALGNDWSSSLALANID